jgi:hypothetical protein
LFVYDDNFLSLEQILKAKQTITKDNKDIIWNARENTAGVKQYPKLKNNHITISEDQQYVHSASFHENKISEIHDFGKYILEIFAKKHGMEIKKILRIKANILNKTDKQNHIHPPHVDMTIPHLVLLYYVNDSDGDTVIFNQKYSSQQNPTLTVNQTIAPKAGAAIVFDGLTYHSSSSPQYTGERIVLNINFIAS